MSDNLEPTQKATDPRKWLLCPRCLSGSVIYKSKTDDYGCRRCGAVFTASFSEEITILKPKKEY